MSDDRVEPVSIILIAYNEASSIRTDVEGYYRAVVEKIPGSELIVTEDGSIDGTSEILRELAKLFPIRLVQSSDRQGYIQALLAAMKFPENEWILFSDTGGKFDPENFWRMQHLRQQADLIIGIKQDRRDQIYRRVISKIFNLLIRGYFGFQVTDIDSGLRLYRKKTFADALFSPLILNDLIASELTLRMLISGARLAEVPVTYHLREGQSRGMPTKKIPRVVFNTLRDFPKIRRELIRYSSIHPLQ